MQTQDSYLVKLDCQRLGDFCVKLSVLGPEDCKQGVQKTKMITSKNPKNMKLLEKRFRTIVTHFNFQDFLFEMYSTISFSDRPSFWT